jgi:hypothetical protein
MLCLCNESAREQFVPVKTTLPLHSGIPEKWQVCVRKMIEREGAVYLYCAPGCSFGCPSFRRRSLRKMCDLYERRR